MSNNFPARVNYWSPRACYAFSINNSDSYVVLKDDGGTIADEAGNSGDTFNNSTN